MQPLTGVVAVLIAVFVGSLPTGYAVGRWLRGIDIRRYSPHNLGFGTVAAAVGLPVLTLAAVLDLTKGALAAVVANLLSDSHWVLAAAAAGVLAGHAYTQSWRLVPPTAVRMKGVAVVSGATVALAGLGVIPWVAVALPAAVGAVVLAIPRAFDHRWGYLSLAAVLAALSLPVALWVLGGRTPYLVVGLAYAIVTIWNYKEHLARIPGGVEPRLGERLPLPQVGDQEAVGAFLLHPMTVEKLMQHLWEVRRVRWLVALHRRGLVADAVVRRVTRYIRPMKVDDIHTIRTADGRRARVYLIALPLVPEQILADPALAVRRAVQAAHLAESLGASVLGLGAYWSVVGNKGLDVQARARIAITNGGAYAAGTVKMAVPLVLDRLRARGGELARATVAVVGANGVVGFGICRQVVQHVDRLIMLGTDQARLERSRDLLLRRYPAARIEATTRYEALREADAIFTATSTPTPVIFAEHVREGCLVVDLGRPLDVDESVKAKAGVEVFTGGVVRPPGNPTWQIDIGYGPGCVPACLAETVILTLEGCYERASLGDSTKSENIDYFVARGAELGFHVRMEEDRSDSESPRRINTLRAGRS